MTTTLSVPPVRMSAAFAITIPILALLILALRKAFQYCFSSESIRIPAVRTDWLGLSNVGRYYSNPVAFIQEAERKYGEIFQVRMFFSTTIWMRNTQLNKQYLEAREDTWSFGVGMGRFLNQIVDSNYWIHFRPFLGSLSRHINQFDKLQSIKNITIEETRNAIVSWQTQCNGENQTIELFESISKLVHRSVVRCLMGEDFFKYHGEELFDLLHEMEDNLGDMWNFLLPHWVPHPAARRLWKARSRMEAIFEERIESRARDPEKWSDASDYITYTIRDSSTHHLKHLYAGHHTVLMFAAHTSVVSLISWSIVELLRDPVRLKKLQASLGQCPDPRDSPYLNAILKETIRHYSSMADIRVSRKTKIVEAVSRHNSLPLSPSSSLSSVPLIHKLKQLIPNNHIISISPYLTHHDDSIYTNPEEWNPERWLDTVSLSSLATTTSTSTVASSLQKQLNTSSQIAYMPFGSGTHRCPGEKMAWNIASNVIVQVLQGCELSIDDDRYPDRSDHADCTDHTGTDTYTSAKSTFDPSMLDFSKIGSPWLKGDIKVRVTKTR